MPMEQVTVRTVDSDCPAYVISPSAGGPWPAVIFYGDAGGIRPAMLSMAERLADTGYLVLLPDNLATDAPTSPHLRVSQLAAHVYIASADKDDRYSPSMAKRLEDSLDKAGVPYRAETYRGASHGWMLPDFPVYDADSADRGWKALLDLFGRTLKA